MKILKANSNDWKEIREIYIQGIKTGIATFETECSLPSADEWFASKIKGSVFKAIDEHNRLLGWSALSPATDRCAYTGVAEVSVYVSENVRGQGIGKKLLEQLIAFADSSNIWTLQAGMFTRNTASIELHRKLGFRTVGIREKIGKSQNMWQDVVLMERRSKVIF